MSPRASRFFASVCWLTAVVCVFGQECGPYAIPYRVEVSLSGVPTLGCRDDPVCVGSPTDLSTNDTDFEERRRTEPLRRAECQRSYYELQCGNRLQWVGGIAEGRSGGQPLALQCCHFAGMAYARWLGDIDLHPNEYYEGGEVLREAGRFVTKFDLIGNMTRGYDDDGVVVHRISVYRMNCIPPPPEPENDVEIPEGKELFDQYKDYLSSIPKSGSGLGREGNAGGGGGGGGGCFTGETRVQTVSGEMRMDELRVGDSVMTIVDGKAVFEQVSHFLHRLPAMEADFVEMRVVGGARVTLTPRHLIYTADCRLSGAAANATWRLTFAEHVAPGDCLVGVDGAESRLSKARVVDTRRARHVGVFAPVTRGGVIVANGFVASCFAHVKESTLLGTLFHWLLRVDHFVTTVSAFITGGAVTNSVHLPLFVESILQALHEFLPPSYLY